jgi:hypothetical protein
MAKISPSSTEKETPSTAVRSPWRLTRLETSMTFMARVSIGTHLEHIA